MIPTGFGEELPHHCALCENNFPDCDMAVIGLGISSPQSMCGDDYNFCKSCWGSFTLGKKLLTLLMIEK